MSGILWLASFPKSGNTWLRAFLANYLADGATPLSINELPRFVLGDGLAAPYEQVAGRPVEGMSVDEIQRLRPKVHEMLAMSSPDTVMVKTHNAIALLDDIPTINPKATVGAVYILRNPLDLTISYAHHYGISYGQTVESLGAGDLMLPAHGNQVHQYLGSWSGHVLSWTTTRGLKPHVVRYEDMQLKPEKTFRKVLKFLKLPPQGGRLKRAIKFSSFKSLADQEAASGFIEAVPVDNRKFFRKGQVGEWRGELSPELAERLIGDHREVMEKYGYLKKDGTPTF